MTEFQFHLLELAVTMFCAYTGVLISVLMWLESRFRKLTHLINLQAEKQSNRTLRLEYWALQQKGETKFEPGVPIPGNNRHGV